MKKRVSDQFWFPFWVDKWIFGSMRIECTLEERAIWIDLLAFASKDEGYIRANEETPYLIQQLVGMLLIPEDKLKPAIKKFIKLRKLEEPIPGIYRITTWEKYQFSESYHRVQKHREKEDDKPVSNGKLLRCNEKPLTHYITLENNKLNYSKEDKEILNLLSKVKDYPFNEERDRKFIGELITEFPDLDALEEIKKKCAWWLSNPLLKKSNPHLQLRNWFINARKYLKEGDKSRDIGKSYTKESEFLPMELLNRIYNIISLREEDIEEFYDKAKSAFPKIKVQWEKSDKKPETFIRLVEGV